MELSGRVAIVTGGGPGIGRATSRRLARGGVKGIVINYWRSAGDAESTVVEVESLGGGGVDGRKNVVYQPLVQGYLIKVGGELTFGPCAPFGARITFLDGPEGNVQGGRNRAARPCTGSREAIRRGHFFLPAS